MFVLWILQENTLVKSGAVSVHRARVPKLWEDQAFPQKSQPFSILFVRGFLTTQKEQKGLRVIGFAWHLMSGILQGEA